MKKKTYLKPDVGVLRVCETQIICASTTTTPGGSGSSYGDNSEESDIIIFGGSGSPFGNNSEESSN